LDSPYVSDFSSLQADIEAELGAANEEEGVALKGPEQTPPPQGAQGLAETLQWILELPADYHKELLTYILFGLKEIINHYRSKNDDNQSNEDDQNKTTIIVIFNDVTLDLARTDYAVLEEQANRVFEEPSGTDEDGPYSDE